MDEKTLKYIETQALANFQDRAEVTAALRHEAHVTVSLFLTGAGAALVFYLNALGQSGTDAQRHAALAAAIWLFILAAGVVLKCLMFAAYPPRYQHAASLLKAVADGYPTVEMREIELKRIAEATEEVRRLNDGRAYWLNVFRLAALLTPACALFA